MDASMAHARNNTRSLLESSWIVSGRDRYQNGYKWKKRFEILSIFENQMVQSKLYACHLIYIQVSIDFFIVKQRIPTAADINTKANPRNILCHETVTVGLASCLLQEGHNQRPDTDDVADNLHQRRHREVPGNNSRSQSMSRCHPFFLLSAFQSDDDELRHRERIQTAKNDWGTLLEESLEWLQVEGGVVDQLLSVCITSKLNVCVLTHMWVPNRDTEGPATLKSRPTTAKSRLRPPLYLLSTVTHTLQKRSWSHVRRKTRVASDPPSNSTLN